MAGWCERAATHSQGTSSHTFNNWLQVLNATNSTLSNGSSSSRTTTSSATPLWCSSRGHAGRESSQSKSGSMATTEAHPRQHAVRAQPRATPRRRLLSISVAASSVQRSSDVRDNAAAATNTRGTGSRQHLHTPHIATEGESSESAERWPQTNRWVEKAAQASANAARIATEGESSGSGGRRQRVDSGRAACSV